MVGNKHRQTTKVILIDLTCCATWPVVVWSFCPCCWRAHAFARVHVDVSEPFNTVVASIQGFVSGPQDISAYDPWPEQLQRLKTELQVGVA